MVDFDSGCNSSFSFAEQFAQRVSVQLYLAHLLPECVIATAVGCGPAIMVASVLGAIGLAAEGARHRQTKGHSYAALLCTWVSCTRGL